MQYDNDGNIISDERNTYTYGEYGQLITVSGDSNASYSYDERGNILTKTDNGETTSFTYANSEWKDQLTKVNDTELTYDANGNMVSYGDTQFTWDYGKSLSSIKDNEKSYYYKYDENGIRTSKTVNGKTTKFNTLGGVVLAQSDSTGIMYFQYDSAGAPIGFVYNDIQYLYITNISGDIIGITDAEGNPIAAYTYDAWGKLLDITTAEESNEEQLSLANANPLRYRGYYYDNETGYYYLQSRYYNPEWGRFISADSFAYLDTQNSFSLNAYIYCWDCPIIFEDAEGTTPKISIDISKIQAFVIKLQVFISNGKDKLTEFGNRILASLQDTIDRCKQLKEKIKCKFTEWGEKANFYIENPYAFFKDSVAKIFKRDLDSDLKRIKNYIRHLLFGDGDPLQFKRVMPTLTSSSNIGFDENAYNEFLGSPTYVVSVIINEIFVCLDLELLAKELDVSFDFSNFEEYKKQRKEIYFKANKKGLLSGVGNISSFLSNLLGVFTDVEKLATASNALGWIGYGLGTASTLSNKALTRSGKGRVIFADTFSACVSLIAVSTVATGGAGTIPVVLTVAGVTVGSILIHNYFEKEAYNSYFDLGW